MFEMLLVSVNEFHSSYIGCFHPGFQEAGFPYKAQIPAVHVTACVQHCRQHNFTFAGLKVRSTHTHPPYTHPTPFFRSVEEGRGEVLRLHMLAIR
jgi:hypothetical protein